MSNEINNNNVVPVEPGRISTPIKAVSSKIFGGWGLSINLLYYVII